MTHARRLLAAALPLVLIVACDQQVSGAPRPPAVTITEIVTETVTDTVQPPDDGDFGAKVFDEFALEGDDGVKKVLVENYNEPKADISKVDCPADQEVKQGNTFECKVTIRDQEQTVKITVVNNDGQYEVSTPEGK